MNLAPKLTPEEVEMIVDAVVKRLSAREQRQNMWAPYLLTYRQAGEKLGGKSAKAVGQMVVRKQLRAVHPKGGKRAYINSKDLEDYITSD